MANEDNVIEKTKHNESRRVEHRSWMVDPPPNTLEGAAKYAQDALKDFDDNYSKASNACWDAQEAIIKYGNALLKVRMLEKSDRKFGEWIKNNKLDDGVFELQQERTAAMQIAKIVTSMDIGNGIDGYFIDVTINGHPIPLSECGNARPSHIMAWYNEMRREHTALPTAHAVSRKAPSQKPYGGPKRDKAVAAILTYEAEHGELPSAVWGETAPGVTPSTYYHTLREIKSIRAGAAGPLKFTKAQEQHVEAKLKAHMKRSNAEFDERVRLAVLEENKDYRAVLDKSKREASEKFLMYEELINNYNTIFTEAEFANIRFCLHPDNSASADKRQLAFTTFNIKKLQLTGKK
jgi:hypothetical protein